MDQDDTPRRGSLYLPRSRRSRRPLVFGKRKIPARMLVPNFFTLLSLCAGVTAIRMAIEQRYDLAVGLIAIAGLLDGIDGRVARALKASSRFGAELDSLADFVNFGVAPAILVYCWGLGGLKGLGWIAVLLFSCAMGLRLARFNATIDVDKPRWQSNYFTGMPAPAGAITVLMPIYVHELGVVDVKAMPHLIALYTFLMACLLVSTLPTFSGKLAGERVSREMVPAILIGVAALVGFLVTYTYPTLAAITAIYLALIPWSVLRFRRHLAADAGRTVSAPVATDDATIAASAEPPTTITTPPTKH
jgi:CDP-diacylglycerol---serine O-phosphatidyltransferase